MAASVRRSRGLDNSQRIEGFGEGGAGESPQDPTAKTSEADEDEKGLQRKLQILRRKLAMSINLTLVRWNEMNCRFRCPEDFWVIKTVAEIESDKLLLSLPFWLRCSRIVGDLTPRSCTTQDRLSD